MTEIKICGLSTADSVDAAVAAGADYLGFNFFPKSPRYIDADKAAALAARVPSHVAKVGIFVDPDDAALDMACAAARLDVVQLHDVADPARISAIAARHRLPVWAVVSVQGSADVASGLRFKGAADRLLFDAKTPKGADLPGGMGLRFDWRLLAGVSQFGLPWGLAGGLDPHNVAEAIAATGAALVDVSSGVETEPGVKSIDKIRAFIKAAKAA